MMSSQWELEPTAGRLQLDEEVTTSSESRPHQQGGRLRQTNLFQFGSSATKHWRSKKASDFTSAPHDSIPWGDILISGQEVLDSGIFWVLSRNVNGLSKACHQADVLNFARAMKDKAVSLFGIQETNRNFE